MLTSTVQTASSCSSQQLLDALAQVLVLAGPGIAALILAFANRANLQKLPAKRATDALPQGSQGTGGQGDASHLL